MTGASAGAHFCLALERHLNLLPRPLQAQRAAGALRTQQQVGKLRARQPLQVKEKKGA